MNGSRRSLVMLMVLPLVAAGCCNMFQVQVVHTPTPIPPATRAVVQATPTAAVPSPTATRAAMSTPTPSPAPACQFPRSPDCRYEAEPVSTNTGLHYQVTEVATRDVVLTTSAQYSTPNDVKAGEFSSDSRWFAAAYHYGHAGNYTWIGVWSIETGKLYSKTLPGWTKSLNGVFVEAAVASAQEERRMPPNKPTEPPFTRSPSAPPTSDIVLSLIGFEVQPVDGGKEFFLDMRYGGVSEPEPARQDNSVDLSAYALEITLEGEEREAQLFFKDRDFRNVYSVTKRITSGQPMRFDPASDPCEVCDFRDFTHITLVGVKVWGGVEGVEIVSARLIVRGAP